MEKEEKNNKLHDDGSINVDDASDMEEDERLLKDVYGDEWRKYNTPIVMEALSAYALYINKIIIAEKKKPRENWRLDPENIKTIQDSLDGIKVTLGVFKAALGFPGTIYRESEMPSIKFEVMSVLVEMRRVLGAIRDCYVIPFGGTIEPVKTAPGILEISRDDIFVHCGECVFYKETATASKHLEFGYGKCRRYAPRQESDRAETFSNELCGEGVAITSEPQADPINRDDTDLSKPVTSADIDAIDP